MAEKGRSFVAAFAPPINPNPRLNYEVTWIRSLGHVDGGNRCGGLPCSGLLRHTVTKAALEGILLELASTFPVTGLEWPRGFQEVKVSRFHDNGAGWW